MFLLLDLLDSIKPLIGTILLLFLLNHLWSEYLLMTKDTSCSAPLPPGSMGFPIVGETLHFLVKGSEFYEDKYRKYGRLFMTHLLGRPTIRIRGSDNLQTVLHGEDEIVTLQYPTAITNILGEHTVVQAHGNNHTALRKRVARAFTQSALEEYVPMITKPIRSAIDKWCNSSRTNTYRAMQELICKINGSVLCGFDYSDEEAKEMTQLIYNIDEGILAIPINLPYTKYRKALESSKLLREKIAKNIRRKEGLVTTEDKQDVLRKLMDADHSLFGGKGSHHDVVSDNAFDLLVLGFATLSSACTSLVMHLAQNPEIVDNIRKEIEANKLNDPNDPLNHRSLVDCKYVGNVVKEVLRNSPPVPSSFRKVMKTFVLDGMQVPKGWTLLYSIRDTLTFSEHYKNPKVFDPDRFSSERREDKQGGRYNFPVFGGGQRSCPGQHLALMVLRVLTIELVRSTKWELLQPDKLKISSIPVPHPVDGMPVKFVRQYL